MSNRIRAGLMAMAVLVTSIVAAAMPGVATSSRAASVAAVDFDAPSASARLGSPLQISQPFRTTAPPKRVELLSHLPSDPIFSVERARVTHDAEDSYTASVTDSQFEMPNTTFDYQFRVTLSDGTFVLGPESSITVQDTRFAWQTLEGQIVRLHWYDGDQSFAERALEIGDRAIQQAEQLLGVTETEKVDFFIYDSEDAFRAALGPGTRENVGGTAVSSIRTLFGLIEPSDINSDWVQILVTHELTHLVFNTATDNPYNLPPRWLNEGLAVYLSEGNARSEEQQVRSAVNDGTIIPLEGLGGLFPTGDGFALAYAESVSAVSYLVDTFGQDALVALIRSYADGVTDDQAFSSAIGKDLRAFDDAWLAWLGTEAPKPLGPQPAPAGPIPPDWSATRSAPPTALLR
jgi:hypothetical protein